MAEIAIAAAIAAAVSAATYTLSYVLQPKPKTPERGRLQGQVQVQDSSYGSMIPIILGGDVGDSAQSGMRVAGNVIFLSDIRKVENIVPATGGGGGGGGGKGGGGGGANEVREISYYVDIGIMFGQPLDGGELDLTALFAGADLVFDNRATSPNPTGVIPPVYEPEPGYNPMQPPNPYDEGFNIRMMDRYDYEPIPNVRGEVSATLVNGGYSALRWYPGNETQEPDPLITAEFQRVYAADAAAGRDVTPAYLGRGYVVLQNFNISKYGAVPNFTAIIRNKTHKSAAQILTALCSLSGVNTQTELDVSALADKFVRGMAITNRASVKEISENSLALRFPFDWTQKAGKLTTVMRGGAAAYDVPAHHLGFTDGGGEGGDTGPERVAVKLKLNEAALPRKIEVKGFDPARDFEIGAAGAKRQVVKSKVEKTVEVNMALTIDEMREIAQRELDTAWLEQRQALAIKVPHIYARLVPTDVINVYDGGSPTQIIHQMRVKEITGAIPGSLEVVGVPTDAAIYQDNAPDLTSYVTGTVPLPATLIGTFIDAAFLRDRESYSGRMGYYVGVASVGNGEFRGASLKRDRGAGYEHVCDFRVRATLGRCAGVLTSSSTFLDVDLYGDAELESYTAAAVAGGSGWIYVGNEALQYTSATPVSGFPNRWRLSGLTSRGGKQTGAYINSHLASERFVLLNEALEFVAVDMSEKDVPRKHKFVAVGMADHDAAEVVFTWTGSQLTLAQVTGVSGQVLGNKLRWQWNAVADPNRVFKKYRVFRDAALTQQLAEGDQTFFIEDVVAGQTSYTIYVVAYADVDQIRSAPAQGTVGLAALAVVGGFTAQLKDDMSEWTWTQLADPEKRLFGYEIYDTSNVIVGFETKPPFRYKPTGRSTTLKIKALDVNGNRSSDFASFTLGQPAPPAPVVKRNRQMSFNSSCIFELQPQGTANTDRIKQTIVEVSNVASFATLVASIPFDGMARSVEIPGSVSANPTVYVRAFYSDAFGAGPYSALAGDDTSYTFTQFRGSDILAGSIGDEQMDQTSAMVRAVTGKWQAPVSGGGDITWSEQSTFRWTQRFISLPNSLSVDGHINFGQYNVGGGPVGVGPWQAFFYRFQIGQGAESANHALDSTGAGYFVAQYNTYEPPSAESGFTDFLLAVHNGDNGCLYLFDGRVLKKGQTIRGGFFIPEASIVSAFIANGAILSAHIQLAQILEAHIATAQITNAHLKDAIIDDAKIALAAINEAHINRFQSVDYQQDVSGIRYDPRTGVFEANGGFKIKGTPLTEVEARAISGFTPQGRVRGLDRAPLAYTDVTWHGYINSRPFREDDDQFVQLFLNVDGLLNPASTTQTNADSAKWTRVRVYNKFGEQVWYMYYPFTGRGECGTFMMTRRYADAIEEAATSIEVFNAYGWGEPAWLRAGNIRSDSPQSFITRDPAVTPQELDAAAVSSTDARLTWNYTGPGSLNIYRREKRGRHWTGWGLIAQVPASVSYVAQGLNPDTQYEFQVRNAASEANSSNIAWEQTWPPSLAAPTFPAPAGLSGAPASPTSLTLGWTRVATTNTAVEVWRNGVQIATLAGDVQTFPDSGLTPGATYSYQVRNVFSGPAYSAPSNQADITTPTVQSSQAPTNLSLSVPPAPSGYTRINLSWNNNGGGAAVVHYQDLTNGGGWQAVAAGNVSNYPLSGLTSGSEYEIYVTNTAGGNTHSNHQTATTRLFVEPDPWDRERTRTL